MKQIALTATVLFICLTTSLFAEDGSGLNAIAKAAALPKSEFVPDELLVQFYVGVSQEKVDEVVKGHGATEVEEIKAIRVKRIKVPAQALEQVKTALSHNPHVKFVENNYIAAATAVPNDPSYISQWHLPKISAPQGWDICTGSSLIGIAVIDSGVDPTHPDLVTKLIPGWSFLTGTGDTHDVYGHGTAVAGTAGALSNNGTGVAGVAWQNPIMPLVVVDGTNGASYSDIASAITYAVDHGMRVLNLSLGGSSSSWTMQNAVSYAWNNGSVVIASAGNDNTSTPSYPAACTNAIAVGSTNSSDNRSSFSNYGTWVTVTAPGSYIFTTNNGGGYGTWSGTSFSSPLTAGLAALVLSVNPALTNQQLKEILINSTDDLGTAGFDQYFGYGRINVAKSLQAAKTTVIPPDATPPTVTISSPADGAMVSGQVTISVNASDDVGVAKVELLVDGSVVAADSTIPYSFLWDTANLPAATYRLQARAYDAAGNFAYSSAVNVTVPPPIDTTAPVITSFAVPATSASLTITGISLTATDNTAVTGYLITESPLPPAASAVKLPSAPTSYTAAASGTKTLYAWARDSAGNVSVLYPPKTVVIDTPPAVTINPLTTPTILNWQIITGTVTDDMAVSSVSVKVNAAAEISATVSGATWSFLATGLTVGQNTIAVIAQDSAGNRTTTTGLITVKLAGDLNDDGVVDMKDTLLALRISVGEATASAAQTKLGDVAPLINGQPAPDGVIDIQDALLILKITLGIVRF